MASPSPAYPRLLIVGALAAALAPATCKSAPENESSGAGAYGWTEVTGTGADHVGGGGSGGAATTSTGSRTDSGSGGAATTSTGTSSGGGGGKL